MLAELKEDQSHRIIRVRIVWFEPHGVPSRTEGLGIPFQVEIDLGENSMMSGDFRTHRDERFLKCRGVLKVTLFDVKIDGEYHDDLAVSKLCDGEIEKTLEVRGAARGL